MLILQGGGFPEPDCPIGQWLSPLALAPGLPAVLQLHCASRARGYSRVPQLLTCPKPPSPLAVLDFSWTSQMGTYQEDQVMARMPALHPHSMPLTLKVSPGEVVPSVLLAKTKAIYSTFLTLRVRLHSAFPSAHHTSLSSLGPPHLCQTNLWVGQLSVSWIMKSPSQVIVLSLRAPC